MDRIDVTVGRNADYFTRYERSYETGQPTGPKSRLEPVALITTINGVRHLKLVAPHADRRMREQVGSALNGTDNKEKMVARVMWTPADQIPRSEPVELTHTNRSSLWTVHDDVDFHGAEIPLEGPNAQAWAIEAVKPESNARVTFEAQHDVFDPGSSTASRRVVVHLQEWQNDRPIER